METINIITLVAIVIVLACVVFQFILIGQLSKKNEELSSMINKLIMTNEEYKASLSNIMEQKGRESAQAIVEVGQDIKMHLTNHKSFLEDNAQRVRKDVADIKEGIDYLSTEVKID